MEAIGLAIGVANLVTLYSACITAIDCVSSYKNFESEEKQLLAQIDANKDILQKWGDRVGISIEGLSETHDERLDDLNTARVICQILGSIEHLFRDLSPGKSKSHQMKAQTTMSAPRRLNEPNIGDDTQTVRRRRDKYAWVIHGKSKLESQTRTFRELVETLDRLVPRDGSYARKELKYDLRSLNKGRFISRQRLAHNIVNLPVDFPFLFMDHNLLQQQKGKRASYSICLLIVFRPDSK